MRGNTILMPGRLSWGCLGVFLILYGVAPAFNSIPGKVEDARKRVWGVKCDDGRIDNRTREVGK